MGTGTSRILWIAVWIAAAGAAAAQVSPEVRFLPGDDHFGTAAAIQQDAVVAGGAGIFLAVWSDFRTTPDSVLPFTLDGGGQDIYARRLDANGVPLDAAPIVLTDALGDQENPTVAWNGSHWLVIWSGPNRSGFDAHLEAVRVAPDGTVLDEPFHVIGAGSSSSIGYRLTSNGSDWLIVYQGSAAGSSTVRGTRITAGGTVLDPGGIELLNPTQLVSLAVASAQGEYLFAYSSTSTTQGIRLDDELSPIGLPLAIPSLSFGSNGIDYFFAWTSGSQLVGSEMSPAGVFDFPAGVPIAPATGTFGVTWDGLSWWVGWQHPIEGVEVARISPAGTVLDFGGVAVDPAFEQSMSGPAFSGTAGGGVQVVWTDRRAGGIAPEDVYGAFVSAGASPGVGQPLSVGATAQRHVDLAAGAGQVLAVFRSDRSGSSELFAQRIDSAGNPLDFEPFSLATVDALAAPRVAWNGSVYLVVWSAGGNAYGRRVQPDGTALDSTPLDLGPLTLPDVDAVGDLFLVAGTKPTISNQFFHPFATRVDGTTGAVLDPGLIYLGQYFSRNPRVVALDGRWLVVWQRHPTHDNPQANVWAAFVETDGTTPGEFVVEYNAFTPQAAFSGSEILIVMRANSSGNANNDIKARRMLPDGTLPAAAFTISADTDRQIDPAVTWNGTDFVAFWSDKRNVVGYWDERAEVFGARIDAAGTLVDPQGFSFAGPTRPEIQPAVTTVDGRVLAAASIFVVDPTRCAYRIGYDLVGDEVAGNRWPVVVATATPTSGASPLPVAFDSTGSFDPDGTIVGYDWEFADGGSSTSANPAHTYNAPGEYLVQLQALDDDGADTLQTLFVRALPANQPPFAVARASAVSGDPPLSVVFESAGSYDPEGSIANIKWEFGDGGTYWGGTGYHTFTQPGAWVTTLSVYDDEGAIGQTTITIFVGQSPGPGECPDGAAVPGAQLMLERSVAGDAIGLSWGSSCAAATDYAIYEGTLGAWSSHTPRNCSTAGATSKWITLDSGSRYWLIVPRDTALEGSYGRSSADVERPQGAGACLPQQLSNVCR